MVNLWAVFLALAFYLAAGLLLVTRLARSEPATPAARMGILALAAGAVVLHAMVLATHLGQDGGINLALTSAFSLIAWSVAVLYVIGSLARPIENLGILILPIAALTLLVEWLWPGQHLLREASGPAATHIVISIVAYGLLTLAAVQALLLLVQEERLRHRHPGGFMRVLPPMQTMETLMFQMIGFGFLLLTATVVSGVFFSEEVFGRPFSLTHHVVLSVLGWVVYGILLAGRIVSGWRGVPAIRWTLAGFVLVVLGYFGSKFVLEVILHRGA
jgi:ABC-type uncharacterized transport system permease subunit